ncbi:MAG: peptidylprolyl isomerase [Acidobacteriota bacterium]
MRWPTFPFAMLFLVASFALLSGGALALPCPEVVATSTSGPVTLAQLEERIAASPLSARGNEARQRLRRLRDLLVERRLERAFLVAGGPARPEARAWLGVLERRHLSRWLRGQLRREVELTEDDRRGLRERVEPRSIPERWRLLNIFRRRPVAPAASEIATMRREIEALRQRLVDGADFRAEARRTSESQTAVRGGRMGTVRLEDLRPEFAAAIQGLAVGEISEVIETSDGWTILKVDGRWDARVDDGARRLARLEATLRSERVDAAWGAALDAERARRQPRVLSDPATGSEAVLVRFADGAVLTRLDVVSTLREASQPLPETGDAYAQVLERVIDDALSASAARRRGALDDPDLSRQLERRAVALRAELEMRDRVDRRVVDPTDAEVRAFYESQKEALESPPALRLRSAELMVDPETSSRAEVEAYVAAARRAAAGAATLSEVQASGPSVRLIEHGWMDPRELFHLGKGVEAAFGLDPSLGGPAAARPGVGEIVGPLQERRRLMTFEVLAVREPSIPAFDVVEGQLIRRLQAAREQRARTLERVELLADLDIRLLDPELRAAALELDATSEAADVGQSTPGSPDPESTTADQETSEEPDA